MQIQTFQRPETATEMNRNCPESLRRYTLSLPFIGFRQINKLALLHKDRTETLPIRIDPAFKLIFDPPYTGSSTKQM